MLLWMQHPCYTYLGFFTLADALRSTTLAAGAQRGCCWNTSSGFVLLESDQHCLSETALWCKPKGIKWEWLGGSVQGWSDVHENANMGALIQGQKGEASKCIKLRSSPPLQTRHPDLKMNESEILLTYYYSDYSWAFGFQLWTRVIHMIFQAVWGPVGTVSMDSLLTPNLRWERASPVIIETCTLDWYDR